MPKIVFYISANIFLYILCTMSKRIAYSFCHLLACCCLPGFPFFLQPQASHEFCHVTFWYSRNPLLARITLPFACGILFSDSEYQTCRILSSDNIWGTYWVFLLFSFLSGFYITSLTGVVMKTTITSAFNLDTAMVWENVSMREGLVNNLPWIDFLLSLTQRWQGSYSIFYYFQNSLTDHDWKSYMHH